MHFLQYLAISVSVGCFLFGLAFLVKNPSGKLNRLFFIYSLVSLVYIVLFVTIVFMYSHELIFENYKYLYFANFISVTVLYHFYAELINPPKKYVFISYLYFWVIFLGFIYFFTGIYTTDFIWTGEYWISVRLRETWMDRIFRNVYDFLIPAWMLYMGIRVFLKDRTKKIAVITASFSLYSLSVNLIFYNMYLGKFSGLTFLLLYCVTFIFIIVILWVLFVFKFRLREFDITDCFDDMLLNITDFVIVFSRTGEILFRNRRMSDEAGDKIRNIYDVILSDKKLSGYIDRISNHEGPFEKVLMDFRFPQNAEEITLDCFLFGIWDRFGDFVGVALMGTPIADSKWFMEKFDITNHQFNVVRLIASGKTNAEIAAILGVTVRTVETHIHKIYKKTKVSSKSELIKKMNGLNLCTE